MLLYYPKDKQIYYYTEELKIQGVDLNREGDASGFLGVGIVRDSTKNKITLAKTGLYDQIVKCLGLQEAKCDSTHTPSKYRTLP